MNRRVKLLFLMASYLLTTIYVLARDPKVEDFIVTLDCPDSVVAVGGTQLIMANVIVNEVVKQTEWEVSGDLNVKYTWTGNTIAPSQIPVELNSNIYLKKQPTVSNILDDAKVALTCTAGFIYFDLNAVPVREEILTCAYIGFPKSPVESEKWTVVKIDLDSVALADFIGDKTDGTKVYATSKKTSENISIQLKVTPTGVSLPNDFVYWNGGNSCNNQLQRMVSKSSLKENGETVTAKIDFVDEVFPSISAFIGVFYVFNGPPVASEVNVNVTSKEYTNSNPEYNVVVPIDVYGQANILPYEKKEKTFNIYYENKKWKFVFVNIAQEVKWGTRSLGRTDIPDPFANPFPLGMGMATNTTESEKKAEACLDLTPDEIQKIPPRFHYWVEDIVELHELFHINDWRTNYYTPSMKKAEVSIEKFEIPVILTNLDPFKVLDDKKADFNYMIDDEIELVRDDYYALSEGDADDYTLDYYQAFVDVLEP